MPPFVERERKADDPRCGTTTGWARHQKAGERPCDACFAAKSAYDKRYRSADDKTRRNRLHSKAQAKALRALKHAHESEYRALYLAYKEQLLGEVTT
tara:strand:+ start:4481 stop:4771 length:291 start_codon:yes stop_codon:yes gene_type:complete